MYSIQNSFIPSSHVPSTNFPGKQRSRRPLHNHSQQQAMSRDYGTMSGPTEYEQDVASLCNTVGISIQEIKSKTAAIQKSLKIVGTKQDNAEYRDNACEIQKQTNETIAMASGNLGQLTRIVRGDTKQRRLQVEKLTSEFQLAVEKYSESQQKLVTKIRKTLLVQDFQNNEPESNGDSQLLQQQLQIHMDDARVREAQMREIESVVVNVNDIMLTLATQITQQGQNISSIESNIESVQGNIEQGASELQKAATYQNKYRKKVLILLLIAIIVGVIITAVIVSDVKN